jgi:hypothetical protein
MERIAGERMRKETLERAELHERLADVAARTAALKL